MTEWTYADGKKEVAKMQEALEKLRAILPVEPPSTFTWAKGREEIARMEMEIEKLKKEIR